MLKINCWSLPPCFKEYVCDKYLKNRSFSSVFIIINSKQTLVFFSCRPTFQGLWFDTRKGDVILVKIYIKEYAKYSANYVLVSFFVDRIDATPHAFVQSSTFAWQEYCLWLQPVMSCMTGIVSIATASFAAASDDH